MIRLVEEPPYEDVLHIAEFMRERDREEIFATRWNDNPEFVARDVDHSGAFRWAAYLDDEPVAAIGAHPRWPNVWTAWAFGTDLWPKASVTLTRHVRRFMLPALFNAGAVRVDCLALQSNQNACRWLEYLGAFPEKTLDFWGKNGETFVSYVWTRQNAKRIIEEANLIRDDQ